MRVFKLIPPEEFEFPHNRVEIRFLDAEVGFPSIKDNDFNSRTTNIYPAECRERHTTYQASLCVTVQWEINNEVKGQINSTVSQIPIMVKSKNCSLYGLTPKELVEKHEDAEEWGGYFIINGIEKILRMLVMPRRNYPIAMVRNSWKQRGLLFTEFGVQIRCVQKDQTGNSNVLHYLQDGSYVLSFFYMKEQFFLPLAVVLKSLEDFSDSYMYSQLIKGYEDNEFYKDAVANMFRKLHRENLKTKEDVLKFMGKSFRIKFNVPEWKSDEEVATTLFQNTVLVHLDRSVDKVNLLVYMTQKLFALANDKCAVETPDNPMNQEVLLGGHLYLLVLKDKLTNWLKFVKLYLLKLMNKTRPKDFKIDKETLMNCMSKGPNIGNAMESFLATGNIMSDSGLGLMQTSGFAVVADKLNFMRYLSHFRCIHRGAFFAQMRTTAVRKLLPEAWGFMCPVHTPDGAPCGLLNHLAALCKVVNKVACKGNLEKTLVALGMIPFDMTDICSMDYYHVVLDGQIVGIVRSPMPMDAMGFINQLRYLKATGNKNVPDDMEIALVPKTHLPSQYPGIFLFTNVARMVRPVKNMLTNTVEYIGSFEQVYMDIALCPESIEFVTTHVELNKTTMLSALASLTPYSDFNQSPRNMYQCQMGKQTMGTPCHSLKHRSDNKMYRLQTPQAPLVRTIAYNDLGVDNYPLGTNAVVAVISYTGYDMEDAMIINKGSYERGFGHGYIYKTEAISLSNKEIKSRRFGVDLQSEAYENKQIDRDGLPFIGRYIQQNEPYYSYFDILNGEYKICKFKHMEPAYIDDVKVLGNDDGTQEMVKVSIKLRIHRNPIIGDKFASRHGQKGILSKKWPSEDMPFSESGMVPDILFNPHGFPSRMTIGMMIESMAGKSAALHGITHDCTPFQFSEDDPAAHYMGEMLVKAGYNYYGNERLYSGINGKVMDVGIFFGVVYYQRLRHMVADKYQVRTTGPVDQVTKQPVQGRKRHGGIRFGEMERDALIAHGSGFLLHDRLFNCSDKCESYVCTKCGNLLSPVYKRQSEEIERMENNTKKWICQLCGESKTVKKILVPYVLKYLLAELTAMNIKIRFDVH